MILEVFYRRKKLERIWNSIQDFDEKILTVGFNNKEKNPTISNLINKEMKKMLWQSKFNMFITFMIFFLFL